jgi:hypothetical protein
MLFRQVLGEIETAAQEVFPGDRIAKGRAFFRGGTLDGILDPLHIGVVYLSEIDRMFFKDRPG